MIPHSTRRPMFLAVRILLLVVSTLLIFSQSASAQSPTPQSPSTFWSGFPHYTDPTTGLNVYQVTSGPGQHSTFYYHQYWDQKGPWVVLTNIVGGYCADFSKVNLHTGQKVPLSQCQANGQLVRGNYFYGFYYTQAPYSGQAYFARQNLTTGKWSLLYKVPAGWYGFSSVTVNSTSSTALFLISTSPGGPFGAQRKVIALNIATRHATVLYDGTRMYQHLQFSPTNPDLFTYIYQETGRSLAAAFRISRVGLGTVSPRRMAPLQLAGRYAAACDGPWPSSMPPSQPWNVAVGCNLAHPWWSSNGTLSSDVAWHRDNPSGYYGVLQIRVKSTDVGKRIPLQQQNLRFVSDFYWNYHFNNAGLTNPSWVAGDGNTFQTPTYNGGNLFMNLMHFSSGCKVQIVNLAHLVGMGQANSRVVDGGRGVIGTWNAEGTQNGAPPVATSGATTSNVFLVQVPHGYESRAVPVPTKPGYNCGHP